jgi:hypothetical protein
VTRDPVEFAREEMARTTAERVPEISYEAEKAVMDELIDEDLLKQEIDIEGPSESQIAAFADTYRRENLSISIDGNVSISDLNRIVKDSEIADAFRRHFTMNPAVARAAFVTIVVGAHFVAHQGADPEQIKIILRSTSTYWQAINEIGAIIS